jgi:hypothetical protein
MLLQSGNTVRFISSQIIDNIGETACRNRLVEAVMDRLPGSFSELHCDQSPAGDKQQPKRSSIELSSITNVVNELSRRRPTF